MIIIHTSYNNIIGIARISWLIISGGVINAAKTKESKTAYLLFSDNSWGEIRFSLDRKNAKIGSWNRSPVEKTIITTNDV